MRDREESIAVLAMLAQLCRHDSDMEEREHQMLKALGREFKLEEELIEAIISGKVEVDIKAPEREADRIPYFHLCVMFSGWRIQ